MDLREIKYTAGEEVEVVGEAVANDGGQVGFPHFCTVKGLELCCHNEQDAAIGMRAGGYVQGS